MSNYKAKEKNNQEEELSQHEKIFDKFTDKKKQNEIFNNITVGLYTEKLQERCEDCGGFLMFLGDATMEKSKLNTGDFCKNRFCPTCAWRKARKDSLAITIMMKYIKEEHNKDFIFLTLTTPNVTGDSLNDEIKKYNNSFKKLMKRTEVLKICKGYIRKLEVTYNKDQFITKELYARKKQYYQNKGLKVGDIEPNFDTYHPHFHVVIAVNKSYFKDGYIKQARWLELWQEATGDNSITQVNVKKATNEDDSCEVYELAKYSAKDSEYLTSKEVFEIFYNALKGKQVLVYSGLFKDAMKLYKAGDLDKYKEKDLIQYVFMMAYKWSGKKYDEHIIRKLTEEELEKYNNCKIDEIDSL